MNVIFDSRFRPNKSEPSNNYQTTLVLPKSKNYNLTRVKINSVVIPNSLITISDSIFTWVEPAGQKSVTFPAGQYTLDSFIAQYAALVTAASSLATPAFTVAASSIDSKLVFNAPTSAGVPQTWQIRWSLSSPVLAKMCGFDPSTDTASAVAAFTSPYTYNFSIPSSIYVNIDCLPAAIIPGATFRSTFCTSLVANSGLIGSSVNDGLVLDMVPPGTDGTVLASSQPVRLMLIRDDGTFADLRGQEWSISLTLYATPMTSA